MAVAMTKAVVMQALKALVPKQKHLVYLKPVQTSSTLSTPTAPSPRRTDLQKLCKQVKQHKKRWHQCGSYKDFYFIAKKLYLNKMLRLNSLSVRDIPARNCTCEICYDSAFWKLRTFTIVTLICWGIVNETFGMTCLEVQVPMRTRNKSVAIGWISIITITFVETELWGI